jgi:opacity protein-like surface antigen
MKRIWLSVLLFCSFLFCAGFQGQAQAEQEFLRVFEKMTFKGDLRLRHDSQWRDTGTDDSARHRERFRLRLGLKAEPTDNTKVGVRLASGSGFQNTTNQSMDGHARGKDIFIDLVYATWEPKDYFRITGGKMKNPLFTFPLVWDADVNPEGLSETVKFDVSDGFGVFANFGQWFLEELDLKEESDRDPTLLAYQAGLEVKPFEKVKLQVAGTYYDFMHLDNIEHKDLSDKESFQGYNQTHGQQMIFDSKGNLLNEFACLELGAKLKFKDVLPVPFAIFGNYIVNTDADIDDLIEKGVDPGDSDPADLLAYGGDD